MLKSLYFKSRTPLSQYSRRVKHGAVSRFFKQADHVFLHYLEEKVADTTKLGLTDLMIQTRKFKQVLSFIRIMYTGLARRHNCCNPRKQTTPRETNLEKNLGLRCPKQTRKGRIPSKEKEILVIHEPNEVVGTRKKMNTE